MVTESRQNVSGVLCTCMQAIEPLAANAESRSNYMGGLSLPGYIYNVWTPVSDRMSTSASPELHLYYTNFMHS